MAKEELKLIITAEGTKKAAADFRNLSLAEKALVMESRKANAALSLMRNTTAVLANQSKVIYDAYGHEYIPTIKKTAQATEKATYALDRQRITTSGLRRSLGAVRNNLLLVTFAFGGLTVALTKFIRMSGEAEEIMSKFKAVFKDNANEVELWAETLGGAVNRATIDIIEWASVLQDTFVPLGFTRDKAAELSQSLVELAIDVASFNNKADADVIRDFQSALVGNHETVRKYGIVITEATMKQLSFGQELTEQEKVQARLNLLIAGTSDAQGDAKRTADSYINSVKGMKASLKELAIAMGGTVKESAQEWVGIITSGADALTEAITKSQISAFAMAAEELEEYRQVVGAFGGVSYEVMPKDITDRLEMLASRTIPEIRQEMQIFSESLQSNRLSPSEEDIKRLDIYRAALRMLGAESVDLLAGETLDVVDEQTVRLQQQAEGWQYIRDNMASFYDILVPTIDKMPEMTEAIEETNEAIVAMREEMGLVQQANGEWTFQQKKSIDMTRQQAIAIGAMADDYKTAARDIIKALIAQAVMKHFENWIGKLPPPADLIAAAAGAALVASAIDAAIPKFAGGADYITTRPQVIMVGEQGPERVRVDPGAADSGGGNTYNIHLHAPVPEDYVNNELIPLIKRYEETS